MDEQKPEKKQRTDQLDDKGQQEGMPILGGPSYGTRPEDTGTFISLPIHLSRTGPGDPQVRWRIMLDNLGPGKPPLGLEILGDVVLGRGKTGTLAPDLDMEPYEAHTLGVSRRHALLRPTAHNLYVIDLGSTNGTYHNGVRLGPGVARVLAHGDTLSIGNLRFVVKIVERPEPIPIAKREKPSAAKEEKPDDTKPFESTPETIAEALPPGSPRKLGARPMIGLDKEETLIVRPGVSPPAGKQPPAEEKESEEKKPKAEAEVEAPTTEKPKEEAKEEVEAPKPEKPKEEAKEPEKTPAKAEAEAPKPEKPKEEAKEPPKAEAKSDEPEAPKETKGDKEK